MPIKKQLARMLELPLGSKASVKMGCRIWPNHIPVFMLHRFEDIDLGIEGHDPSFVRWSLEYLRSRQFHFVSIDDVARAIRDGRQLPPRSIAFTMDDGYFDQTEIGTELFAAFDCPATLFVTTGFIDGEDWLWSAKVDFMLRECSSDKLIDIAQAVKLNERTTPIRRQSFAGVLLDCLKRVAIAEMPELIGAWSKVLEVELPVAAPERYRPSTWEELCRLEAKGLRVGPHTVSHPILANESSETASLEIETSIQRVYDEVKNPSKVFCYPVGYPQSFSERDKQLVRASGCLGAVSAVPETADVGAANSLFRIPRFGFPNTKQDLIQYATWIEVAKAMLRRRFGARRSTRKFGQGLAP